VTAARLAGRTADRRRERIRLEISREAVDLFWRQGVAGTTGDQIAGAVGLSTRTLWRYFRNKESCAEPVLALTIDWLVDTLRSWPDNRSLDEHLAAALEQRSQLRDARRAEDDLLAVRVLALAETDLELRAVWLLASDRVEQQLVEVVAARLGRPATEAIVRAHAAAAAAVIRAANEDVSRALLAGATDRIDIEAFARHIAAAVRTATGGAVGDRLSGRTRPRKRG
jgi:AcrR family transcriptional regulator